MKVLQLCSIYGDSFFENLICSIDRYGSKSYVYYPRRIGKSYIVKQKKIYSPEVFNVIDRLTFFSKEKKMLDKLEEEFRIKDFDLLHAHTLYTDGYQAYKLNKKYGIPYVVAVRSTDLNFFLKLRKELFFIAKNILENSSKIIFLSESYKRKTLNIFGKSLGSKSVVIPNGLDPIFSNNKNFIYKPVSNTINILSVGYISKRKNQLATCKAVNNLYEKGVKIKYTIIGKSLNDKILQRIKKFPFVEVKEFMKKEDLINEYRKSDVFVMPSKYETFGLTYLESISQNVPVIYTRNEGFDGWFEEGEVGFPVDYNKPEEISDKITMIIKSKKKMNGISKKLEIFEWQYVGEKYNILYNEVKNEKSF